MAFVVFVPFKAFNILYNEGGFYLVMVKPVVFSVVVYCCVPSTVYTHTSWMDQRCLGKEKKKKKKKQKYQLSNGNIM